MLSRGYLNDVSLYGIGHEKQPILNLQTAGLKCDRWTRYCQPCHCLQGVGLQPLVDYTTTVCHVCGQAGMWWQLVPRPEQPQGMWYRHEIAGLLAVPQVQSTVYEASHQCPTRHIPMQQLPAVIQFRSWAEIGNWLRKKPQRSITSRSRLSVEGVTESFTFTRIPVRIISARSRGCKRVCQKC